MNYWQGRVRIKIGEVVYHEEPIRVTEYYASTIMPPQNYYDLTMILDIQRSSLRRYGTMIIMALNAWMHKRFGAVAVPTNDVTEIDGYIRVVRTYILSREGVNKVLYEH